MTTIQEVTDIDMAFPVTVEHLMPEVPDDYRAPQWASKLFSDWFYAGVSDLKLQPKKGVDPNKALRHIKTIMGSFEPKHEDKTAACEFLLDEWFQGAEWKVKSAR
jgi:hypothetical protein